MRNRYRRYPNSNSKSKQNTLLESCKIVCRNSTQTPTFRKPIPAPPPKPPKDKKQD